jgi:hypothetical protein
MSDEFESGFEMGGEHYEMSGADAIDDGVTTYLPSDAVGADGDIIPAGTTLDDI